MSPAAMHAITTLLLCTLFSAVFSLTTATTTAAIHDHPPPTFPHPGTFRIHHPACPPILPKSTLCETATWYLHLYPEQQFTVSRTRDPHKWEVAGVWDAIKPAALVLEFGDGNVRVWEVVGDKEEGRVQVEERVGWDGEGRQGQAQVGKHEVMELERVV
ncbi:hypothetical protein GGF32_001460 [Allomyces javanicus]|nr:hypothetical protein GGF32_001460 [Allomyces javanicus]